MKLPKRIITVLAVIFAAAIPVAATITPAFAGTGFQWGYEGGPTAFLNNWGNGGQNNSVKVWESLGTSNNDFTLVLNHAYNHYVLEFTGNGTSNLCIGDQNNDPNNGYAALEPCGFTGNAGWGVLFDLGTNCPSSTRCFKNLHWTSVQNRNDWLGPVNNYVNGSPFTLNNVQEDEFTFFNAA